MSRFLGLTEQEMSENEKMWAEEQGDVEIAPPEQANLRSVGVTPGGIATDLEAVAPATPTEPGAPGVTPAVGGAEVAPAVTAGGGMSPVPTGL